MITSTILGAATASAFLLAPSLVTDVSEEPDSPQKGPILFSMLLCFLPPSINLGQYSSLLSLVEYLINGLTHLQVVPFLSFFQ